MCKIYRLLSGIALVASVATAQAQNLGNSPYSSNGFGDLNESSGSVRAFGMGNIGVGTPASSFLNSSNPALLYYNNRVIFEMGLVGQAKELSDKEGKQRNADGSLNYLGLAVPISRRWSSAVSLRPFSSVNYEYNSEGTVTGDPTTKTINNYTGSGNISEVFFGHGIKVAKRLNVGVSASYLFGQIDHEASTQLYSVENPDLAAEKVVISELSHYSGFQFKGALAYRQPLKGKWSLNAGSVYTFGNNIDAERRTVQQRRLVNDFLLDQNFLGDSLFTSAKIPQALQLGVSIDNGQSLVIGADFSAQQWEDYTTSLNQDKLANTYRLGVGAEYTPNPTSINSYFQRVTYRGGASFATTPVLIGGKQVNDMSLHWGFSLPIGGSPRPPEYTQSLLNLGFAVGKRSTGESDALTETYFRMQLGFSLNSNWFIKPKID